MPRFCSLFSSSSGNSTFVGTSKNGILIDAGASAKRLKAALSRRDIDPETLCGIFVTHEHSDHISGIRVLASSLNLPVFATRGTLEGLEAAGVINGKFPVYEIGEGGVELPGMLVKAFKTPHDSNESCGYTVEFEDGQKAAIATDIGHMTDTVSSALKGCELVMLESNHDVGMLQNGMYPYYLKRRILSDFGHLSNECCAEEAKKLIANGTTRLFLGHLSTENNMPELARQTTLCALQSMGATLGKDFLLTVNPKENTDDIVRF